MIGILMFIGIVFSALAQLLIKYASKYSVLSLQWILVMICSIAVYGI